MNKHTITLNKSFLSEKVGNFIMVIKANIKKAENNRSFYSCIKAMKKRIPDSFKRKIAGAGSSECFADD